MMSLNRVHCTYMYMYLVFQSYGGEVWGGEGVLEQLSISVPHVSTHPPLHHQLTQGRINDRTEG